MALLGPGAAAVHVLLQNIQQQLQPIQPMQLQLQQQQQQLQQQQQQLQQVQQQLQQIQQQQQQILAQIGQLLAVQGVAAVADRVHDIAMARADNFHTNDTIYVVVNRGDGTPPPSWPAGFNRVILRGMTSVQINGLLGEYGLPLAGTVVVRRNALARHIGTGLF